MWVSIAMVGQLNNMLQQWMVTQHAVLEERLSASLYPNNLSQIRQSHQLGLKFIKSAGILLRKFEKVFDSTGSQSNRDQSLVVMSSDYEFVCPAYWTASFYDDYNIKSHRTGCPD
jgi:hypothetical protein